MIIKELEEKAKILRYLILLSTTKARSGHPTSSLSAVDLIISLFFEKYINIDFTNPKDLKNDRFILSKGHAAPLLYGLYVLLGYLKKEELLNLRKFSSFLQGHPIPDDFLVDVATGSLGQGVSIGLGMAMGLKLKIKNQKLKIKRIPKIWVLLGDSEIAEGQIWEAVELASFYRIENLVAIVDINRLGQRGQTMVGWQLEEYKNRFEAFGWQVFLIDDGHNFLKINKTYQQVLDDKSKKPKVILAKTIKGKGISFLENKEDWHGKALSGDLFDKAVKELNIAEECVINNSNLIKEDRKQNEKNNIQFKIKSPNYQRNELISTRKAYGLTLRKIGEVFENIVVLDAEVSNSTFSEIFKEKFPDRFFEMFIAEQNMISVGVGFSKVGFIPFCSSFSAFLTRAFDQMRMATYSEANLKICGSHGGVSIGEDGVSQMGLEDLAMVRSIFNSVVFYPCDAVSTEKLMIESLNYRGIVYFRTTRGETPVIYDSKEKFEIGGFKILKSSSRDQVVVISAGITVFEALRAYEELKKENIFIRVIDLYCIKPINKAKLIEAINDKKKIITVEDHYLEGGLGEAVSSILSDESSYSIYHLAVKRIPRSGKKEELLAYEEIDNRAIINKIKRILGVERKISDKIILKENKEVALNNVLKKLKNLGDFN